MKQIWFCHGVLFKTRDVYSKENIDIFKNAGINCANGILTDEFLKINKLLKRIEGYMHWLQKSDLMLKLKK